MKKEKLSFKSIKNAMSRSEMKKVMAGSGEICWIMCGPTQTGAWMYCNCDGTNCSGCI
jgi:hypothetical protein